MSASYIYVIFTLRLRHYTRYFGKCNYEIRKRGSNKKTAERFYRFVINVFVHSMIRYATKRTIEMIKKIPTSSKQELAEEFDSIMNQTTGYNELDHRLRLTKHKRNKLLVFLDNPGIPIENNLAERDLRPVVIMRKLTGGTKSEKGDRSFERHMSVIQTARKQELNVFKTLHGLMNENLSPFILTQKTLPALSA